MKRVVLSSVVMVCAVDGGRFRGDAESAQRVSEHSGGHRGGQRRRRRPGRPGRVLRNHQLQRQEHHRHEHGPERPRHRRLHDHQRPAGRQRRHLRERRDLRRRADGLHDHRRLRHPQQQPRRRQQHLLGRRHLLHRGPPRRSPRTSSPATAAPWFWATRKRTRGISYGGGVACIESNAIVTHNVIRNNVGLRRRRSDRVHGTGGRQQQPRLRQLSVSRRRRCADQRLSDQQHDRGQQLRSAAGRRQRRQRLHHLRAPIGQRRVVNNIICNATSGGGMLMVGDWQSAVISCNNIWNNSPGNYLFMDQQTGETGLDGALRSDRQERQHQRRSGVPAARPSARIIISYSDRRASMRAIRRMCRWQGPGTSTIRTGSTPAGSISAPMSTLAMSNPFPPRVTISTSLSWPSL